MSFYTCLPAGRFDIPYSIFGISAVSNKRRRILVAHFESLYMFLTPAYRTWREFAEGTEGDPIFSYGNPDNLKSCLYNTFRIHYFYCDRCIMDGDILKMLSEELRETRNMVIETRRMADAAQKSADAAGKSADAAIRRADAAWELVVMTRTQIEEDLRHMKLPWWKKLSGKAA